MGGRILIVDDDRACAELVGDALEHADHEVEVAAQGVRALQRATAAHFDIALVEVELPTGPSGFSIGREVLARGVSALMFVTRAGEETDRLQGFALGADDYVVKPFVLPELTARVNVVLRRLRSPALRVMRIGRLAIDEGRKQLWYGAEPVQLTATEFNIICELVRNSPRVISKLDLLDRVWGYAASGNVNIVEVHVHNLRRKLEACGPRVVHTSRGHGYAVRAAEGAHDAEP